MPNSANWGLTVGRLQPAQAKIVSRLTSFSNVKPYIQLDSNDNRQTTRLRSCQGDYRRQKEQAYCARYALRNEVNALVGQALDSLVADGSLVQREASVNRIIAYEIPETQSKPAL